MQRFILIIAICAGALWGGQVRAPVGSSGEAVP